MSGRRWTLVVFILTLIAVGCTDDDEALGGADIGSEVQPRDIGSGEFDAGEEDVGSDEDVEPSHPDSGTQDGLDIGVQEPLDAGPMPEDANGDPDDTGDYDAGGDDVEMDIEDADIGTGTDTGGGEDVGPVEPDVGPPLEPGGFGDWCDDSRSCDEQHFCVWLDQDPRGVCTRNCPTLGQNCLGIPAPNTRPKCHYELDDGQYACAFVCLLDHIDHVHIYDCPPELSCQQVDWSTNDYCL